MFQAFGIKRECADEGYGLNKGDESLSEVDAIFSACNNKYVTTHMKEVIDSILEKGGKIISSSPIDTSISVYRGDNLQPGNKCLGREYFLEAPEKVFKQFRGFPARSVSK